MINNYIDALKEYDLELYYRFENDLLPAIGSNGLVDYIQAFFHVSLKSLFVKDTKILKQNVVYKNNEIYLKDILKNNECLNFLSQNKILNSDQIILLSNLNKDTNNKKHGAYINGDTKQNITKFYPIQQNTLKEYFKLLFDYINNLCIYKGIIKEKFVWEDNIFYDLVNEKNKLKDNLQKKENELKNIREQYGIDLNRIVPALNKNSQIDTTESDVDDNLLHELGELYKKTLITRNPLISNKTIKENVITDTDDIDLIFDFIKVGVYDKANQLISKLGNIGEKYIALLMIDLEINDINKLSTMSMLKENHYDLLANAFDAGLSCIYFKKLYNLCIEYIVNQFTNDINQSYAMCKFLSQYNYNNSLDLCNAIMTNINILINNVSNNNKLYDIIDVVFSCLDNENYKNNINLILKRAIKSSKFDIASKINNYYLKNIVDEWEYEKNELYIYLCAPNENKFYELLLKSDLYEKYDNYIKVLHKDDAEKELNNLLSTISENYQFLSYEYANKYIDIIFHYNFNNRNYYRDMFSEYALEINYLDDNLNKVIHKIFKLYPKNEYINLCKKFVSHLKSIYGASNYVAEYSIPILEEDPNNVDLLTYKLLEPLKPVQINNVNEYFETNDFSKFDINILEKILILLPNKDYNKFLCKIIDDGIYTINYTNRTDVDVIFDHLIRYINDDELLINKLKQIANTNFKFKNYIRAEIYFKYLLSIDAMHESDYLVSLLLCYQKCDEIDEILLTDELLFDNKYFVPTINALRHNNPKLKEKLFLIGSEQKFKLEPKKDIEDVYKNTPQNNIKDVNSNINVDCKKDATILEKNKDEYIGILRNILKNVHYNFYIEHTGFRKIFDMFCITIIVILGIAVFPLLALVGFIVDVIDPQGPNYSWPNNEYTDGIVDPKYKINKIKYHNKTCHIIVSTICHNYADKYVEMMNEVGFDTVLEYRICNDKMYLLEMNGKYVVVYDRVDMLHIIINID